MADSFSMKEAVLYERTMLAQVFLAGGTDMLGHAIQRNTDDSPPLLPFTISGRRD